MTGRLALLGLILATLPLSVDLPADRDSSRAGALKIEVAGGGGQFAIVSRGCNGEVERVVKNQIASGALVVEQPLPHQFVVGARAGNVRTRSHEVVWRQDLVSPYGLRESTVVRPRTNPYVNPGVAWESRRFGVGVGALMADQPFRISNELTSRMDATAHLRFGEPGGQLTLRWMEDVPLESEGHFSVDLGFRPTRTLEAGMFGGFLGPYDGAMIGLRGRWWFTPEAAAEIKASTSAANGEYGVFGGLTARLGGRH